MNENWNGYTILLSSVNKESTAEKFNVYIPKSYVRDYVSAPRAYYRYLKEKVRCTPGMIAGVVEKGIDFSLIAPTRRMFKKQLEVKHIEKVMYGINFFVTTVIAKAKYHVYVLA